MRKLTIGCALVLLLVGAGGAWSQSERIRQDITQQDQREVSLTIYNANLGLVKDVRDVHLPSGQGDVRFMDVAAQIDPTSVHLKSLTDPNGLRILEQNYEYDLLSAQKLMEKYVGRRVRIYQNNGSYQEATLLSANGPIFEINGQIHVGHAGTLVYPSLPDNLVSKPTLVWLLRNAKPAPQRVEASYLTSGMSWKADYVLVINPADTRGDLSGWVTIDNQSGAAYREASLKLVAGDIHRAQDRLRSRGALELAAKAVPASVADRAFVEEGFFEYHLYTLDGRTTVKNNQTKQIALLAANDVPVVKRYVFYGAENYYRTSYGVPMSNQKVSVLMELTNARTNNLGMPLPKGKLRVYKADRSGSQQLIGEDWIDHTPKDEKVKVKLGEAFDVVGERVQKDWKAVARGVYEVEWEITLRNHKTEDATVEVIEPLPGDWEVLRSTHPHEKLDAHTVKFVEPVPKDGASKVTYRVRLRW
ncbi:MAG: DUF4139 domain-containing protein [Candidatus Rokubacteria bacterium]|nr:DUF4139 domain-containing protein [Candidatus Rokubacteria bacterium]